MNGLTIFVRWDFRRALRGLNRKLFLTRFLTRQICCIEIFLDKCNMSIAGQSDDNCSVMLIFFDVEEDPCKILFWK